MKILYYREKINTECDVLDNPELDVKAIDLDKLKSRVNCAQMKSCDYLRKKKRELLFIEISDIKYEISDSIENGLIEKEARKKCKEGIRLKLSETIHIFDKIVQKYNIDITTISDKKAYIATCRSEQADVIAWSRMEQGLTGNYVPQLYSSIKIIPYTTIDNLLRVVSFPIS